MIPAPAIFDSSASLGDKLRAIRRLAVDGSRSAPVRDLVASIAAEHHRKTGSAVDRLDGLRAAYARLRHRVAMAPDPGHDEGEDLIQHPVETLKRSAGDCDDHTTLVLALARAWGFNAAPTTLSVAGEDPLPVHVFAEVEVEPGRWVPADMSQGLGFGHDPAGLFPEAPIRERWESAAVGAALGGFFDSIVGGVASIFNAKANKDAAREQRKGLQAQAAAISDQAAADREASDVARVIGLRNADVTEHLGRLDSQLRARGIDASERNTARVLRFVEGTAPMIFTLITLAVMAPVLREALA